MNKVFIFISISIIVGTAAVVFGQPPRFPKAVSDIPELEAYLTHLVASNNPPGISITVISQDEIVYRFAVGTADPQRGAPVTHQTVYHWWSMTKVITAVGIMQLHEGGKLDIDSPLRAYLPWFSSPDPEIDLDQITVRQLLNHTSGLPDMVPAMIGWVHYEDEIYEQTKILKRLLPDYGKPRFLPGEKSAYTNFGYLVLGALIEAVSGKTYESYVIEHILHPVGMDLTQFLYTPQMSEHEAFGSHPILSIYTPMLPFLLDMNDLVSRRQRSVYWFNRLYLDVTPSSGLIGSTDDAAQFMIHYLDPEGLMSLEAKQTMLPTGSQPNERPLGWAEFQTGERLWLQHRGGGPGFATIMRIYPEESLGIVVMANGTNLPSEKIVEVLSHLFLDKDN